MTPKIKEFCEIAESFAYENESHWEDGPEWLELFQEKFTRLIINECAKEIQSFVDLRIPASEYPMKLKMNMGLHDEL